MQQLTFHRQFYLLTRLYQLKGTITSLLYVRDTLISRFFFYREIREINVSGKVHSFFGIMVLLVRIDIHNFIVEDVLGWLSVVTRL